MTSPSRQPFDQLTSKLMHDLITPVGAISGGLELLESQVAPPEEVMPILRESLDKVLTLLILFRGGWGRRDASMCGSHEKIEENLQKIVNIKKHLLSPLQLFQELSSSQLSILFSLSYLLGDCCLPGSTYHIKSENNHLTIEIAGKLSSKAEQMGHFFDVPLHEADCAQILWSLTADRLSKENLGLSYQIIPTGLSVTINL